MFGNNAIGFREVTQFAAGEYFRSWSDIGLNTQKSSVWFISLGVYLDNNPRYSGIDFWSIRIYLMNSVQSLPRSLLAFVESPKSGDFGRISWAVKSSEEQGSLVPSKYTPLWYPLEKDKRFRPWKVGLGRSRVSFPFGYIHQNHLRVEPFFQRIEFKVVRLVNKHDCLEHE